MIYESEKSSKDPMIHLLGVLIVVSTFYHSNDYHSLLVSVPIFLTSFSFYKSIEWLKIPALCATTLYAPFTMTTGGMDEFFSLLVFSVSFLIPVVIYWVLVLGSELHLHINSKGVVFAVSYLVFTVLFFYLIPFILGISEFFLSAENRGAQALLLIGFGLVLVLPYQIVMEIRTKPS